MKLHELEWRKYRSSDDQHATIVGEWFIVKHGGNDIYTIADLGRDGPDEYPNIDALTAQAVLFYLTSGGNDAAE